MIPLASLLVLSLVLFLRIEPARACTTVLVGRGASETGEVLVGHNEDSGGRYAMRTHLVPELERGSGRTVRFEPGTASLPLPEVRARLFWSEARPFVADGGASFCDFFVNGHGVVLCSDNCTDSREDRPDLTDGGVGYGIRRLVSEGARSACHAVELAAGLLDRFGYASSGRSYHFADKDEIWVLQAVRGKHYAVKRVPDDEVYLNPNHYTIRDPDPEAPGYRELVEYARSRGWYDPSEGPFDFALAFQASGSRGVPHNVHRHVRGLSILMERDMGHLLEPGASLPFSVRPPRPVGVETVKRILRTHFEGTPSDVSEGSSPHFMPTRPVCASTTLESSIVQIRRNPAMTLIRRALGRPCLAPYVPWYFGMTSVPEGYGAPDPEVALATHFSVPASDLDHTRAAWFRHTALQAAVDGLYAERASGVRERLLELETKFEEELRAFEPEAEACFRSRPDEASSMLDEAVSGWTARTLSVLDELYAGLGVLEAESPSELDADAPASSFSLLLNASEAGLQASDIVLDRTVCGPHYLAASRWSAAVEAAGDRDRIRLSFCGGDWFRTAVPCLTDLWVLLEDRHGRRHVGRALVRIRKASAGGGTGEERSACDCA